MVDDDEEVGRPNRHRIAYRIARTRPLVCPVCLSRERDRHCYGRGQKGLASPYHLLGDRMLHCALQKNEIRFNQPLAASLLGRAPLAYVGIDFVPLGGLILRCR